MKLTVMTDDDRFQEIDLFEDSRVSEIKQILEIEFSIPATHQELYAGQFVMQDNKLIKDYCKDFDMIRLTRRVPSRAQQGGAGGNNGGSNASAIANQLSSLFGNAFSNNFTSKYLEEARNLKQQIRGPEMIAGIRMQNPELAHLIETGTDEALADYIKKLDEARIQKKMQQQRELDELMRDEFNPENQKKIQEIIYKKQIDENLEMAQEYMPEVFGKITMLYIDIVIDKTPIQAFVDTGAESTIMSKDCAERCGLMRLVDTRYSGIASGVGTGKILGRIHSYPIQILDQKIPCSFTVLESINLDFLLGLDSMRRYQCLVNLRQNSLDFLCNGKEVSVPFLPEGEIKKTVSISQEQALFDQAQKEKQAEKPASAKPTATSATTTTTTTSSSASSSGIPIGGSGVNENQVASLMQIPGVTRAQAIQALSSTQGNLELAKNLLSFKF